ncbi:MAG: 50S ribosomal protein L17 [Candidatus Komeilibacteria bacterium RIFCSPLOWO2_01_FULL_45_10]|uniref:Large ribosomal subunit protein bL17 n=1 Tax=Candidatus Komeilibacteria bacterium RIFCSPLOWO2_01_FULL_45_10 TaxID=1798550 RepID=A0A1G2BJ63_9BACT|nr:MAG: 50S ribosomal protein L17 [Candidatus Komeilibacteria bacterium RIFCSPLOWO2_01_FULL_45_10]
MRHRKKKIVLDRKKAPRVALLKNLACQLILYEKIKTTAGKARVLRPLVEKLISRGKIGTLASRRLVASRLPIKSAVKKVFEVLGPRYKERPGGYLRIIKLNPRQGDGAKMALIEFV